MNIKKRILSAVLTAAMLLGSAAYVSADTTASLSPRAATVLESGYIKGFEKIPTADEVASQFDGEVVISDMKNNTVTGTNAVPADSAVLSGDEIIAFVHVPGDAFSDGKININDVTAILKHIAKWGVALSTSAADTNDDGKINVNDVTMLLKYIAKWDVDMFRPVPIVLANNGASDFLILDNDPATDAAFNGAMERDCGIRFETVGGVSGEDNYIAIGTALADSFTFIDKEAADAAVADGKAYIDTYGGDIHIVAAAEAVDFISAELAQQIENGCLTIPRGYAGPLAYMTERSTLYWNAVENLLKTEPSLDDTNSMSEDLAIAIANAPYTAPKNIIYMIGDGMGKNIAVGAKCYREDELYGGKLAMNYLPTEGRQSTYSSNEQITDSAAGGTALATGFKTDNGVIAMNTDLNANYKTLLELAAEQGKSTGIVATKSVTDATPAAFTAHVQARDMQVEIANQQLAKLADGTLDILLGGGNQYFNDAEGKNSDAIAAAEAAGLTYTSDFEVAKEANFPIAGIFADGELNTNEGHSPHIAAMTDLALNKLSNDGNENGYFIMIEGSQIDSWNHLNNFKDAADETYEFDCAVAVAMRYVALNPDTVLIVTADHETGGLSIVANPTQDTVSGSSRYSTNGHFWMDVPVYAAGYSTEALGGYQENAEVAIFIAGLMSDEEFGQRSEVVTIADLSDKSVADAVLEYNGNGESAWKTGDGVTVFFDRLDGYEYFYIPKSVYEIPEDKLSTVSAIRVTYTNVGEEASRMPTLGMMDSDTKNYSRDRQTFVHPGETVSFTYVLESTWRYNCAMTNNEEILLFAPAGFEGTLNVSKVEAVVRPYCK